MFEGIRDIAEQMVRDEKKRAETNRRPWSSKRVAKYLACSATIVRDLVDNGKLRPISWRRPYRFTQKEVDACIARCRTDAPRLPVGKVAAISQRVPDSAIYFLIDKGKVVYVGQSINPMKRIGQHVLDRNKQFTEYAILEMHKSGLNRVEHDYIRKYRPKYNLQGIRREIDQD